MPCRKRTQKMRLEGFFSIVFARGLEPWEVLACLGRAYQELDEKVPRWVVAKSERRRIIEIYGPKLGPPMSEVASMRAMEAQVIREARELAGGVLRGVQLRNVRARRAVDLPSAPPDWDVARAVLIRSGICSGGWLRRLRQVYALGLFAPEHMLMARQCDVSRLLGESRQAMCNRQLALAERLGVPMPGSKGTEAREKYSIARKKYVERMHR